MKKKLFYLFVYCSFVNTLEAQPIFHCVIEGVNSSLTFKLDDVFDHTFKCQLSDYRVEADLINEYHFLLNSDTCILIINSKVFDRKFDVDTMQLINEKNRREIINQGYLINSVDTGILRIGKYKFLYAYSSSYFFVGIAYIQDFGYLKITFKNVELEKIKNTMALFRFE